jgi:hypothetical protein
MSTNTEFYNIVVVGAMNPRLHSPSWYRQVGLIDQDEMEAANNSPQTFMTPLAAQFQFKDVSISCLPDRWEAQTRNPQSLDRLRTITGKIFDEFLKHTPVEALGFNFNYERTTKVDHVDRYLAECLAKTRLGLKDDCLVSGNLSIRRSTEGRNILVTVSASLAPGTPSVVAVSNNFEYKFSSEPGYFSLAPKLGEQYDTDHGESEDQTSAVVKAIDSSMEHG